MTIRYKQLRIVDHALFSALMYMVLRTPIRSSISWADLLFRASSEPGIPLSIRISHRASRRNFQVYIFLRLGDNPTFGGAPIRMAAPIVYGASRMIDKFLEGNKRFLERDFVKAPEHYGSLVSGQHPTVLWIGCSDSRVDPERITGSRAGELFVQRNIGNIVPVHDWNFATVLEYAINHLEVGDIVICGHSDCGAIKGLDHEGKDAYIPLWLNNAREAKRRVDDRIQMPKTPEEEKTRLRLIEIENVGLQLEHLRTYPPVMAAEKGGRVRLHGLYFDLETGELKKMF